MTSSIQDRTQYGPYCGYHQNWEGGSLKDLTEVGPGTPNGELLRRYWHPVSIASDVGELPKLIQVLGEELVLFKDLSGNYGLVHKKCPHRRASLEFGHCQPRGIRCCYHGWVFDVDGTVLEIPGEPEGSEHVRHAVEHVRLGAYPVREFRGLLFAYLGPPQHTPELPFYDTYELPDLVMTPYAVPFNCNWIQVLDAIVDPVHTAFLHESQFSDGFGKLGAIEFYQRDKLRFLGTASRRVGDNIWVRVNELILPNFTQAGAAFACDGTRLRYFGRSAFTRWVVPLNDRSTMAFAWGNFGERADPPEYNTLEGLQQIEQGEILDRTYEERQRRPGDVEAVEGMGAIADQEKEFLLPGDQGVSLYRRQLRQLARNLEKGQAPPQPTDLGDDFIPTYGSDTVLHKPLPPDQDDQQLLRETGNKVIDILFDSDEGPAADRDSRIITQLQQLG